MANRNLDAKHEKILKALLRLSENKRCAVCDTLGPQYVVINFSTFVCTICSGVHRQFSHRCKGISMATFKPEEIRALEEGGNGVALACFLAKWTPRDAPKPVDRNVAKIRDWIDLVFVKRRYYSKDVAYVPPVSRTQSTSSARSTASRENDVSLKIAAGASNNGPVSQGPPEPAHTTPEAGSLIDLELLPGPAAPVADVGQVMDAPAAVVGQAAMPEHNGWDTFGDTGGGAPAVAPAGETAAQSQDQGWSTFEEPAVSTSAPVASTSSSSTAGGFQGWQAFDTTQPSTPPAPSGLEPPSSRNPVMKELPSDLFSELAAPQSNAQQPMPGALPYAQLGAPVGQAGVPVHPGYAPGMMAYSLQPGPVPPGYISLDQQYFLPSPGVAASPAPHTADAQGPGSSPAAAAPQHAPPQENDIFSSLVPGLRSSLPSVQPPPASAATPFNAGALSFLPQCNAAQQPPQFPAYGMMNVQHCVQPAVAQSNGSFECPNSGAVLFQGTAQSGAHGLGSFVGDLPGHAAFGAPAESRPKRAGGNPFAY